jgi:hypothetical protein
MAEVRHSFSGSLLYQVASDQPASPCVHLLTGIDGKLSSAPSREAIPPASACSSLSTEEPARADSPAKSLKA